MNVTDHSLTLTGLQPATTYLFQVCNLHAIDGDCLASSSGSFTTLGTFTDQFPAPLVQSTDPASAQINTGENGKVVPVKVQISQGGSALTNLNAPGPVDGCRLEVRLRHERRHGPGQQLCGCWPVERGHEPVQLRRDRTDVDLQPGHEGARAGDRQLLPDRRRRQRHSGHERLRRLRADEVSAGTSEPLDCRAPLPFERVSEVVVIPEGEMR